MVDSCGAGADVAERRVSVCGSLKSVSLSAPAEKIPEGVASDATPGQVCVSRSVQAERAICGDGRPTWFCGQEVRSVGPNAAHSPGEGKYELSRDSLKLLHTKGCISRKF